MKLQRLIEESRNRRNREAQSRQPVSQPDVRTMGGGGGPSNNWWGKIISLNALTGHGTAKRVEGTYPYFDEPGTGEPEVDVILGVYALQYCPTSSTRYACFVPSGGGVTPAWTAIHHYSTPYTEPTTGLHADQDDGGGTAGCST